MPKHILIPVALDHEAVARSKLALAETMLDSDGRITLLTVLESIPGFVAEFVSVEENHLTQKVRARLQQVAGDAANVATEVVTGKPGVKVCEYARENGVDLIIVGSHAPGASGYALGSTAARIARRAPCSVYILR